MKKQSKMVKNLHNCFNDLKKIIYDNHIFVDIYPFPVESHGAQGKSLGEFGISKKEDEVSVREITYGSTIPLK